MSVSVLQLYDHYLSSYRLRDRQNDKTKNRRYHTALSHLSTHDDNELKKLYSNIQLKNRFSPLLMNQPSAHSIAYAVYLKENATRLTQTINLLSGEDDGELFAGKNVFCDNNELADIEYIPQNMEKDVPDSFTLKVDSFATPQINMGSYLYSDERVTLEPGNYSFDLINKKVHYELQFAINADTNIQLQQKIADLINNSELGVHAQINISNIKNSSIRTSSIDIISDNCGATYSGKQHFTISEESTTYNEGLTDYLGLNSDIQKASNAKYYIDDNYETSYSNDITVFGGINIKLNPMSESRNAYIELKPDTESIADNIEAFVSGYNQFVTSSVPISENSPEISSSKKNDSGVNNSFSDNNCIIIHDMKRFLELHKENLSQYGITVNDDASLNIDDKLTKYLSDNKVSDIDSIKLFGIQMLKKLDQITLDPMEYTIQKAYAYPNPYTTYINPYMTSIYTGLLFNMYT